MASRRDFLALGAWTSLAGVLPGQSARSGAVQAQERQMLRTTLCDRLRIDYPIVQAPMQAIVTPQLVAAVGDAGGMGVIPGMGLSPDALREQIRQTRALSKRPFGVNLVLHAAVRSPVDPATVPAETRAAVQRVLNRFRARLGLPASGEPLPRVPDVLDALFSVIVDERVAVFSTGLGLPTREMVDRCHAAGITVMSMVATVADAVDAAARGVDIVVAQGSEAGGHRSLEEKPPTPEIGAIGTMALLPQVARAVRVPVVAAGGIMDGRGLAAAMMLGASGVLMGTRFIATTESAAPRFHKQALAEATSDQTTLSDAFTGHYARFLRNTYTEEYRSSGAPVLPAVMQQLAARDIFTAAAEQQVSEFFPLYAGQGVGMIENSPDAAEIVRAVVREARAALGEIAARVQLA